MTDRSSIGIIYPDLMVRLPAMKKPPKEVELSREEGEALMDRLEKDQLSLEDRRLLMRIVEVFFWLTFALRESKIGLKRLKGLLFGKSGGRTPAGSHDQSGAAGGSSGAGTESASSTPQSDSSPPPSEAEPTSVEGDKPPRPGHGRWSREAYPGAERRLCRHEQLESGQRCPACGRGRLYGLAPAGVIRLEGNALVAAVRFELERLRCSGCGEVFTAALPGEAGPEKYSARARAVLAIARYYLGLPFHCLERFQALVGVPVADATQWDQVERVADCARPVFDHLQHLAAQGRLIHQDDTHVCILTLKAENRRHDHLPPAQQPRRGMYTTGLLIEQGGQTICLYRSGRAHAGENLGALLAHRAPGQALPLVMSDALAANHLPDETKLTRCYCLAHALREFTDIEEHFPQACTRVLTDLRAVFHHEAQTRRQQMDDEQRLAYHQRHSAPLMAELKAWLVKQLEAREVEPNSSLGKALNYLLNHWQGLTQFLRVAGAPVENNRVERALKLIIRQRRNSLFYATPHSAYIADLLTSLIATCAQGGINALEYLVALQTHRREVLQEPRAWLPWNYPACPAPG